MLGRSCAHLPKQPKGPKRGPPADTGQAHGLAASQRAHGGSCFYLTDDLLSCCNTLRRRPP